MQSLDRTYRMCVGSKSVEGALSDAESAVDAGRGLEGTGFWTAVTTVKRQPELAARYAERIAAVDAAAFRRWAWVVVPLHLGTVLMVIGTVVGFVLVALAYPLEGMWAVFVFYAGLGVLLVTTHGLAHLLVGTVVGIRFVAWFIGSIRLPQPGVKVDYVTYLRASARRRAWMHASGAIVTKTIPFALIGAAVYAGLPAWAVWGVPIIGVITLATDVAWSTKSSDWKKFRREMRLAQTS